MFRVQCLGFTVFRVLGFSIWDLQGSSPVFGTYSVSGFRV